MLNATIPVRVSSPSLSGRQSRLLHRGKHGLDRRKVVALLFGYLPAVHQDGELAPRAVRLLHFDPGLLSEFVRHTGGMFRDSASHRAMSDDYLLHGVFSFLLESG